jgi:hypothetical protein
MAFTDILSTSFLFSVAIIIILIGAIFAYVSYRMSEQDHKITSMLGLVSTMAEELQFFRSKLSQIQGQGQTAGQIFLQEENNEQIHKIPILDPNNLILRATNLIPVSDDEDEDEDEDQEDDGSETGSETDSETGSETGSETNSEEDETDLDEVVDLNEVVDLEETIHLEEPLHLEETSQILTNNINDIDENLENLHEIKSKDTNNIKSIHLEETIEINGFSNDSEHEHDHDHSIDILASDLKTISITDLEYTNKKTDYKKISINKLREIVIEKGIVSDASKLKKGDILKLLGDE